MKEKIGGYDAELNPRAKEMRDESIDSYAGYSDGYAEAHSEAAALAKEVLDSFHMGTLKDVFREYLQKSGVPLENTNDEVFDRIFLYPLADADAEYRGLENILLLSTKSKFFETAKADLAEGRPIREELLMEMQLFFVHEICHAFSRVRVSSVDTDEPQSRIREEAGYGTHEYNEAQPGTLSANLYEALNEGMTQRIAEEVFLEYQQRVGKSGTAKRMLRSHVTEAAKELWTYSIFSSEVDSMCAAIGNYAGIPKEEVWKAFKKGYFEDPRLFEDETVELFEETFGKDFLASYEALKRDTETSGAKLGEFDATHGFADPRQYAEKWLRHLGTDE
ncbi:MAG TPA: hypothetical protein VG102_03845 [Candidatus Paceibacterota bacterium]|jgi:hypothetical protein|nr:hypothetical protein [Candidatus Paceibacterota bacterium]